MTQEAPKRRMVRPNAPVAPQAIEPVEADEEVVEESAIGQAVDEEGPAPKTRKQAEAEASQAHKTAAKAKAAPKVEPTDDFVRKKNGEIRKDEDGDDMRYAPGFHQGAGFVNGNGVRFPPGYKFHGGFIGTFGNVIVNRCPKCKRLQSIDEARSGICGNRECGWDAVAELEEVEPAKK